MVMMTMVKMTMIIMVMMVIVTIIIMVMMVIVTMIIMVMAMMPSVDQRLDCSITQCQLRGNQFSISSP